MDAASATIVFRKAGDVDPAAGLLLAGYARRTTATEPRLPELVAEYRRIGFDVQLIAHQTAADECGVCYEETPGASGDGPAWDIYVRRASESSP